MSSPVKIYKLTPEEIAEKFKDVKPSKKKFIPLCVTKLVVEDGVLKDVGIKNKKYMEG